MNGEERQFVIFSVRDEEYALPIEAVSSVIRFEPATPVPRSPGAVDGVINLRGRVIPVVDLARAIFGRATAATPRTRIVVAELGRSLVGLVVDSATQVASVPAGSVMAPPSSPLASETAAAIEGVLRVDGRLVVLLDLKGLLPGDTGDVTAAANAGSDG